MSKIDLVIFFPDNTYEFKKCSLSKTGIVKYDKNWKPKLKTGLSHFPERPKRFPFSIFHKKTTRYFGYYGEPELYTLDEFKGKLNKSWDKGEAQEYVKKAMAFALVEGKPFSNLQVIVLLGGMIVMILIGLLILRRIGI